MGDHYIRIPATLLFGSFFLSDGGFLSEGDFLSDGGFGDTVFGVPPGEASFLTTCNISLSFSFSFSFALLSDQKVPGENESLDPGNDLLKSMEQLSTPVADPTEDEEGRGFLICILSYEMFFFQTVVS